MQLAVGLSVAFLQCDNKQHKDTKSVLIYMYIKVPYILYKTQLVGALASAKPRAYLYE